MNSLLAGFLLTPFACTHRAVMNLRNHGYDRGWLKTVDVQTPVLSVGNITAGGTGKTPLTAFLIEGFLKRGQKVGLVSRGYGGTEKGPAVVPTSGTRDVAKRFGDEPTWLAARFPNVPVMICGNRVEAAQSLLLYKPDVEIIIADDAFQHRRLKRSLDVVVIDASEPMWHYRPLPLGREREGFSSLNRAHAVCITKSNLCSREELEKLSKKVHENLRNSAVPVFIFQSVIENFEVLNAMAESKSAKKVSASEFVGQKVLLVSGIGRPQTFDRLIHDSTGAEVLGHLVFKDHHSYSNLDLEKIVTEAKALGTQCVIVTEKDAVKLRGWKPPFPVYVSLLEMRCQSPEIGEFYETARGLLL